MAQASLSLAEKTFILHGVETDLRADGRCRSEYRPIEIETNVMPQTNGSARLRLGNTDILASVKVEIDTPSLDAPDQGKLEFFIDCSANAAPEFEGRGGEDLCIAISNILKNAYTSPNTLDLTLLGILPGKKCWKMYVDVLILQCDGNLTDAIGAAVKSALFTTEIPRVTTVIADGDDVDVHISDDPFDCIKLHITNYPILVTVCKVGDYNVADLTADEELCASTQLIMAVTPTGLLTSFIKIGCGSVQSRSLISALELGRGLGIIFNTKLMRTLRREADAGPLRRVIGFSR